MEDAITVIAVFSGIALVFKVIGDAITRNRLIAKGLVNESIKYLFARDTDLRPVANIKWGLAMVGIGLALLLDQFGPFYMRTESTVGLMFLFAGIAFLVYYWIAKGHIKEQQKKEA